MSEDDGDDGTGQTSGEDTQEMPIDQQKEEWEEGEEESPIEEEDERERRVRTSNSTRKTSRNLDPSVRSVTRGVVT